MSRELLTVCMLGKLGDVVAMEPAFRYLREKYPDRIFRWYAGHGVAPVFRAAPFPDETVEVSGLEAYLGFKQNFPPGTVSYEFNFRVPGEARAKRSRGREISWPPPLLEQFAVAAGLPPLSGGPRFYVDETAALPEISSERLLVFHCRSYGRSRQWPAACWRKLAAFCMNAGWTVAEIGQNRVLDDSRVVDCTGRIDLHTAARLIRSAKGFVGVESGFGHMANALGTFGVIVTGRLREYYEYNFYTGNFSPAGNRCNLAHFYGVGSDLVPYAVVEKIVGRLLEGRPFSYLECENFCLHEQVLQMRRTPLFQMVEKVFEPFCLWKRMLRYHRMKKNLQRKDSANRVRIARTGRADGAAQVAER